MKRKIGLFSLILVLLFALTGAAAAPGPGAGEAATNEEILAETTAGIEALEAPAAVKEQLRTMARTWLRDGEKAGLTGEQLRELMQAMVQVCAACDLEKDRTKLRSACRLMIQVIGEDSSPEEVCNRLRTRLEEGETLAQAVKAVRREMDEEQKGTTEQIDEGDQEQQGGTAEETGAGSGSGSGDHGEKEQGESGSGTSGENHGHGGGSKGGPG